MLLIGEPDDYPVATTVKKQFLYFCYCDNEY